MKLRKIVFISCILISAVLFTSGVSVLARLNLRSKSDSPKRADISHFEFIESEPAGEGKSPINILILGVDEEGVRSDVILLINYSPEEGKINMLSVARDTRIKVRGRYEKFNALVGLGGEILTVNAIEQLTGLHIKYYLTLNFKGFRKIIDTLDGVEFEVPFDMNYDDPDQNLHIHLKRGVQVLNGEKAEHLVRYRKGNRPGDGYIDGDMGRIKMQQDFMKALVQQKIKLKYVSKADDIFMILKKYIKTNFEIGDVDYYLKDLKKIRYDQVKMYTIPGDSAYIDDLWYFICDKNKTKELINNKFYK